MNPISGAFNLRALAARLRPPLPSQCEVCRQWCATPGSAGALCGDCVTRFTMPKPRCARCGLRLGLAAPACGACLREPPPFERTVCAVDYAFPWHDLLAAFKFRQQPELARLLAARLIEAVQSAGGPLPALVLPVPLAPTRLAERGYNQAWALAQPVAAALRLPARADMLLRHTAATAQSALNRAERQRNLRQAFMVDPRQRPSVQDLRIALVDDVMTTGATAREAAAALRRGGAAAVQMWVFARTPDQP